MMQVLGNALVVIVLQYLSVWNEHMYTLNLNNAICQLDLNKAGRKKDVRDWTAQFRGLLNVDSS